MNPTLTIAGIEAVALQPLGLGLWRLTFRSPHAALAHQAYLNGRLAAWTKLPAQRWLLLDAPAGPARVTVAAVPPALAGQDLSAELPADDRQPGWVFRPRVLRDIACRRGDWLELLDDHATGLLDPAPVARAELWPAWMPRWAFGEDVFGQGGFGYDGHNALGLGRGAFGAGPFGFESDLVSLEAALDEPGRHQLVLRIRGRDGRTASLPPVEFDASPPPAPPASLTAADYDPEARQLTLLIE